ncbi:MAG: hypothetical protein ACWGOX_14110 [Desulforhopalus sp.]
MISGTVLTLELVTAIYEHWREIGVPKAPPENDDDRSSIRDRCKRRMLSRRDEQI